MVEKFAPVFFVGKNEIKISAYFYETLTNSGNPSYQPSPELKDRDDIPLLLELKSCFKMVWMESTSPCNSLIDHSLKWRCCSLVGGKALRQKPVLTFKEEINRLLDCQPRKLWLQIAA